VFKGVSGCGGIENGWR